MLATMPAARGIAALGALLEFPDESFQFRLEEALASVKDGCPEAASHLESLAAEVTNLSKDHAQELYTRAFDLTPLCIPYVSVHVFGAESFKRAELMTGLKAAYERAGVSCGSELPDHIAIVLRSAPHLEASEWSDLKTYVLRPALETMEAPLEAAHSPWRHVLKAVQCVLSLEDETDGN